jgi:hypothetical protein
MQYQPSIDTLNPMKVYSTPVVPIGGSERRRKDGGTRIRMDGIGAHDSNGSNGLQKGNGYDGSSRDESTCSHTGIQIQGLQMIPQSGSSSDVLETREEGYQHRISDPDSLKLWELSMITQSVDGMSPDDDGRGLEVTCDRGSRTRRSGLIDTVPFEAPRLGAVR